MVRPELAIGLVLVHDRANVLFESVCKQPGKDFVIGIQKRDRTPIGNISEITCFGKKGDDSSVK